jgi:regulator of PEP synthase PpsR (kinase-PPPase family)
MPTCIKHYHLHMVSASGNAAAIAKAAVQCSASRPSGIHPMVRNRAKLEAVLRAIEHSPGIVLYLVNTELGRHLEECCAKLNVPCIAVRRPVLQVLESYFGHRRRWSPGSTC